MWGKSGIGPRQVIVFFQISYPFEQVLMPWRAFSGAENAPLAGVDTSFAVVESLMPRLSDAATEVTAIDRSRPLN
jgi:hypothetical protein